MRECFNCQKEYEHKRESSKFCSDKCRVMYNRKNPKPKDSINPLQAQVLYNEMLAFLRLSKLELPSDYLNIQKVDILKESGDIEPLSFDKLKQGLVEKKALPTFQELQAKVLKTVFPDEREELIHEILGYTHLADWQATKLLNHLKTS